MNIFDIPKRILVLFNRDSFSDFDEDINRWSEGFDLKEPCDCYSDIQKNQIEEAMQHFLGLDVSPFDIIINPKLEVLSGRGIYTNN